MELPFKICVDSRALTRGHASDFEYSLPETISLDHDTVMYVNTASVTNTFSATGTQIGAKNHYVYFFEKLFGSTTVFNRAVLQERAYEATELAPSLQTALNAASWFGDDLYTCQYNETRQHIEISRPVDGSRTFFIPSNDLMENPAFQAQTIPLTAGSVPYTVNWSNLQSAHDLLGLGKGTTSNLDMPALLQLLASQLYSVQATGAVDCRPVHNVYITSNALSHNNVIGIRGSRTTVIKIPVLGLAGDIIHRAHSGHAFDYVNVGNRTLSTLDFQIRDSHGNVRDLRGEACSLELLFCARPL